jgi:acyl carrier protein
MTDRQAHLDFVRNELHSMKPRLPAGWTAAALYDDDLDLDSLDLVELVARIEQRYGLLIPDEDLAGLVSLDATADYLVARAPK